MPKAYSGDMRERVIGRVASGASRREAAEQFEVSASTAIIWVKCFEETGRCAAKPRGGSTSPLEKHADFLLGLILERADLTLDEVVSVLRKHKIPGSSTAVWRVLRKAAERTIPRLRRRIGSFGRHVTAREASNYFRHAGYA